MAPTKSKTLADFSFPKWSTQQPRRSAHRRGQISAVAPPPPTRQSPLLTPHPTPPLGVVEPSRQRQSPNLASPRLSQPPVGVSPRRIKPRLSNSVQFQSPVRGSAPETAPPPPPEQVAEKSALVATKVAYDHGILKFCLGKRKREASQTQPPQPQPTTGGQDTAEQEPPQQTNQAQETEPPQPTTGGQEAEDGGGKRGQEPPQPTSGGHETAEEDGAMKAQQPPQPSNEASTLAGSSSGGGGAPATQPPAAEPKVKLPKLSLALTPREIAEDLYSMGITTRPTRRRTKKRPAIVQRQIDRLVPGSQLGDVSPAKYKVSEPRSKGY